MFCHCPPDDTAAIHVEHHCEREKAHPCRYIRDVRHPQLVGGSGSKIALDEIRKATAERDVDERIGLTWVLIRNVFHEQENQHVIFVLRGIHAPAQFVKAFPE